MSLETQIAALVTAANTLTAAVDGKVAEIDVKVNQATAAVPATVRAEVVKDLYVDAAVGDDNNAGTMGAPLKTVGAALGKIITGGVGFIFLQRGQVHEVGSNNVNAKVITFLPYGAALAKPVLRGRVSYFGETGYAIVNAFEGAGLISVKFSEIRVETGILPPGATKYPTPDFGGFFSRSGGFGESVTFEVMFHKCEVDIQDFTLFSTYYGSMTLSLAISAVTKSGTEDKIVRSTIPKVIDIVSLTISGFPAGSTVDTLFTLTSGGYIARTSTATVNNAA